MPNEPTVQLHLLALNHHKRMILFGLLGAAAGALAGTLAVPHIPRSQGMYTVIVPFSTTYIGLASGFFVAGARKFFDTKIKHAQPFTQVNSEQFGLDADQQIAAHETVGSVINDFESLKDMLVQLTNAGIKPKAITVVALDSDELRDATAPLHRKRLDPAIFWLAASGFLIGAYWGYIGCPALNAGLPSVVMSSLMAGFCGALLGLLAGAQIGSVLHLDNGPVSDATMLEGKVEGGVAALAVYAETAAEAALLARILGKDSKKIEQADNVLTLQIA